MRIKKLIIIFCLILFSSAGLTGCITLKKGRPPKLFRSREVPGDKGQMPMISRHQIYKDSYALWKACSEELIDKLGLNRKKDILLRQRIIENLERMQGCLTEAKSDVFNLPIKKFKGSTKELLNRRLTKIQIHQLKRILSRQKRELQRKISYKEMNNWIKSAE
jgi:hypothetical protein